ncbi:SAM-dependent methyltransferase [Microbacterium sp. B35-04]|uniref:class I SAM-dependent methyltransferase n=1 Tax=unclassified Microbacterium TaxID=2609290 RepID=UPI0013D17E54|nr:MULTISPECIES: methyltransferase [unclassified Microbacterium]KAF2414516.1 SAM-dependent methyltransferase [Microbacterium sp. B35-04]KAF2417283.1 SAM-dependent methyltransferase [Microbacterium sp. B35-30]
MTFSLDGLRRWPDVEAPGLVATDAADRLLLDESAAARAGVGDGGLTVIGDGYGALTLGAAADGGRGIRVHQDPLTGERALAANAGRFGLGGAFASLPLAPDLVRGARVVLVRLPRSLEALRDIAGLIAAHAAPEVVVFAGGRIKHMTLGMNDVLRESFGRLDVSHARQKSRVLVAREPHDGRDPAPRRASHDGIVVCAFGGAFAGASIDIGTRFLLDHLPGPTGRPHGLADEPGAVIDFACGTGVIAAGLAVRHPDLRILATDQSAAAVASATATARANGVDERVEVVRDDMLGEQPDGSASFIALNPPFHSGSAVHEGIAPQMFAEAARVLRPGGELWTVWNSGLRYRQTLEKVVGPTRQIARNAKFTVTASTRR